MGEVGIDYNSSRIGPIRFYEEVLKMEFPLSKEEEIIFREIKALAGDMEQIAGNLVRHHEERLKAAEAQRERAKEAADEAKSRGVMMAGMPMQALNRPVLLGDLRFIQDRLSSVIKYIEGDYVSAPK